MRAHETPSTNLLSFSQIKRKASLINILCSELVLYRFLLKNHLEDFRTARLRLRIRDYNVLVPQLLDRLARHENAPHWEKAFAIEPELVKRYNELGADLPEGGLPLARLSDR